MFGRNVNCTVLNLKAKVAFNTVPTIQILVFLNLHLKRKKYVTDMRKGIYNHSGTILFMKIIFSASLSSEEMQKLQFCVVSYHHVAVEEIRTLFLQRRDQISKLIFQ